MTDRPKTGASVTLPPELATRLLERASELDATGRAGASIDELRAAAAEAGISERAFETALAEMRTGSMARPDIARDVHRRTRRTMAIAAAVALLAFMTTVTMRSDARRVEGAERTAPGAPGAPGVPPLSPSEVVVRSAEDGRVATLRFSQEGGLFSSLGVAPGADGQRVGEVQLGDGGGTVTTPAALRLGDEPGTIVFTAHSGGPEIVLTVPGTAIEVRGSVVRLVRDERGGPLRAEGAPR